MFKGTALAHSLPALPGLAKTSGDRPRVASPHPLPLVRPGLSEPVARETSARLVTAAFAIVAPPQVAESLDLERRSPHHWTDPTRPGPTLSAILQAPPPWSGYLLSRALVVVEGPTRRWTASPQALVARIVAGAAQVASILEKRDLDACTPEQLEEMRSTLTEKGNELKELTRQIDEALERKRADGGC